jgi:soluble lytic murein transglycosylase-like protein
MKNLRGSYVHRGDAARRRARVRRSALFVSFCGAVCLAWTNRSPSEAHAEATDTSESYFNVRAENVRLKNDLESARGDLELSRTQLARWGRIYNLSSKYHVGADMAANIYDIALSEGIEPELGFRLVRAESEFNAHATSPVGAIGLTQVMPATARYFEKGITRERLYDQRTNLRVGFRYLRTLVREYKGSMHTALLVYNRGPVAVETLQKMGADPSNGYDRGIMRGYTGRGVID